ncbi:MAG: chorismate synthase, partial [Firmicutes bacterium]|nr:chorismate synthase [Bacillota bacterium]
MRIVTAGESHGKCLVGIIEGFPAHVPLDREQINYDLWRRQQGYGRGPRMAIEKDEIIILGGVRGGLTLGSPIAFQIKNRDYENWQGYLDPWGPIKSGREVEQPRPGHADLAGAVKYGFRDIRNVIERSSARETAVRVAVGSIAGQLLALFQIRAVSHVVSIGQVQLKERVSDFSALETADESVVRCVDPIVTEEMVQEIRRAEREGDSLGGIFEIRITGVPIGLGSYVHWDRKLDGKLAQALMSIQGIKGVEIGDGFQSAKNRGSQTHDPIFFSQEQGYYRLTNHCGGIEGGVSNGEDIVIRCAMKPIPTLTKPLETVNIRTKEPALAGVERSDTCAVP